MSLILYVLLLGLLVRLFTRSITMTGAGVLVVGMAWPVTGGMPAVLATPPAEHATVPVQDVFYTPPEEEDRSPGRRRVTRRAVRRGRFSQ